jgi:hypothetical protein
VWVVNTKKYKCLLFTSAYIAEKSIPLYNQTLNIDRTILPFFIHADKTPDLCMRALAKSTRAVKYIPREYHSTVKLELIKAFPKCIKHLSKDNILDDELALAIINSDIPTHYWSVAFAEKIKLI